MGPAVVELWSSEVVGCQVGVDWGIRPRVRVATSRGAVRGVGADRQQCGSFLPSFLSPFLPPFLPHCPIPFSQPPVHRAALVVAFSTPFPLSLL